MNFSANPHDFIKIYKDYFIYFLINCKFKNIFWTM